tara:strand:+ start:206402 stop:206575 length:174 start_codon:yes stop_codon:yes gene_type:complete
MKFRKVAQDIQKIHFFIHQNLEKAAPLVAAHFIKKLNVEIGTDLIIPKLANETDRLF